MALSSSWYSALGSTPSSLSQTDRQGPPFTHERSKFLALAAAPSTGMRKARSSFITFANTISALSSWLRPRNAFRCVFLQCLPCAIFGKSQPITADIAVVKVREILDSQFDHAIQVFIRHQ